MEAIFFELVGKEHGLSPDMFVEAMLRFAVARANGTSLSEQFLALLEQSIEPYACRTLESHFWREAYDPDVREVSGDTVLETYFAAAENMLAGTAILDQVPKTWKIGRCFEPSPYSHPAKFRNVQNILRNLV